MLDYLDHIYILLDFLRKIRLHQETILELIEEGKSETS